VHCLRLCKYAPHTTAAHVVLRPISPAALSLILDVLLCHPCLQGEFDDTADWFCNAYTTRDYLTFEDCYEDWTLFGPHYKQLWQEKGVQGIQQLRQRCNSSLTSLMRGLNGKKLGFQSGEKRVRRKQACSSAHVRQCTTA
jgi:hypothetical protein